MILKETKMKKQITMVLFALAATVGIRIVKNGMLTAPGALLHWPNPIRAALFNSFLKTRNDLTAYDAAGNKICHKSTIKEGIYLVKDNTRQGVQRITVIK